MQVLDVSRNRLQGELPAALGGLSQLLVLDVSSNNFSGPLPAAWSGMTSLTRLTASHNKLQVGQMFKAERSSLSSGVLHCSKVASCVCI